MMGLQKRHGTALNIACRRLRSFTARILLRKQLFDRELQIKTVKSDTFTCHNRFTNVHCEVTVIKKGIHKKKSLLLPLSESRQVGRKVEVLLNH